MSLSLSIVQPTGVNATYWNLGQMNINNLSQTMTIEMNGYLDSSSYLAGCTPLCTMIEQIGPVDYVTIVTSENIIAAFYTVITSLPDFIGAIPC